MRAILSFVTDAKLEGPGILFSPASSDALIDVAMHDFRGIFFSLQIAPDYFCERHGTVPPARASQRNREIALPFTNVKGDQVRQQTFDPAQEFSRLRKRSDVARHLRIFPAEGPQLRHEVRVRQKSHIEDQI